MLAAGVLAWALGIWLAPWLAAWLAVPLPATGVSGPEAFVHGALPLRLHLAFGAALLVAAAGLVGAAKPWRHAWLLVMLLALPAAAWAVERAPRPTEADVYWLAPRRYVTLVAAIATPPARTDDGWRARLAVTTADGHAATGTLDASFPAATRPGVGLAYAFTGRLGLPEGPRNPGEQDRAARLARQGIFATFQAESAKPVGPAPGWALARVVDALRVRLLDGLSAGLTPQRAALFGSLVLGTGASPVEPSLADDFRNVGLAHLLAASGAQVGMLAGLALAASARLRLAPWATVALTLPTLVLYLALTGAPASMVRATLMAVVALGALAGERDSAPFVTLWLAAALMLIWDPGCLFDLGFQFSFLATYALCRLAQVARGTTPEHKLLAWVKSSLRISWAANAWVLPLQLLIFQQGSWLALPANLITEPLVLALTPWGLGVAALGAVSPALGRLTSPVSNALLALLEALVRAFAAIPWGQFLTPAIPVLAVCLAYLALACGRQRPRLFGTAIAGSAIAVLLPGMQPDCLELAVLSVGQGDGIVLHTPGNHWILVDAGPAFRTQDAGKQVLLPYLQRRGCRKLDLVVVTHCHLDHVGGLPAIAHALPVARAWDPGQHDGGKPYHDVLAAWLESGTPWAIASTPATWCANGVTLEVLSRPAPERPPNDGSIVLRVGYGAFHAVLMGDAEADEEHRLLASGATLRADVLKVGHHGSRTSSTPALLAAVRPRLAIISVGRNNRFGHPDRDVIERLAAVGVPCARTDSDGGVLVRSDGLATHFAWGRDGWTTWRTPQSPAGARV